MEGPERQSHGQGRTWRMAGTGESMRVAVYYRNDDVRVEQRPVPEIGPGEMLVKVQASGVCGSDVMEWYRLRKAPLVLGHEIAGEVVKTGAGVSSYKRGDRVFVSHHVPCNTCEYCLAGMHTCCDTLHSTNFDPGGFSQYIRVPAINVDRGVFLLPQEISYGEATFIEPLACVLRGQRMGRMGPGKSVLVFGAGISGLLHIALAKALGAGLIMAADINTHRVRAALKFGAHKAWNAGEDIPAKVKRVAGRGAQLVIVCAGALCAYEQALGCVDRGGVLLAFAPTDPGVSLPVPINDFWRNGVTLAHAYGAGPADISASIKLLKYKRVPVKEMITHNLPLDKIQKAFHLVAAGGKSIKVVIWPNLKV